MSHADDASMATQTPAVSRITYTEGGTWRLVRRHLLNVGLMILTLGIYRFWAITLMRQILWRRIRFDGQPLEYTGNGLEIFLGFVRVFLIILLPLGIIYTLVELILERSGQGADLNTIETVDFIYAVVVFGLWEMGRFLSWRYRISRTRWRGIRGRIELEATKYLQVAVASALMVVLSGWLLKPIVDLYRARMVINALNVGGLHGRYIGGIYRLLGLWLGIWLVYGLVGVGAVAYFFFKTATIGLSTASAQMAEAEIVLTGMTFVFAVVVFGIYLMCVYRVAFWRWICTVSNVGPVRATFHGTALGYTWLTLGNWLILIFSIGLLAPITWERKIRYLAANVTMTGVPDPAGLRQVEADDNAFGGEGLAGDFDIA
ncbi:DUF898 family protein [Thalassobaculum sp. OXR-137]|uniref:DUF898 family protein n=1 Tax=Thalassobaculum sp. OXR-137 TaxID=3100173 RepID=UPI002AC89E89|nr:DUF898 family protein [Thalassobaculum sp. OXR-137]WPZ36399.1 DUF898 family protein [Thalassobaculum sp. OXR-137]